MFFHLDQSLYFPSQYSVPFLVFLLFFQPYAPAPNVPSSNRIMPPPSPSVSNTSSNQSNGANSSANGSGSPHSIPACAINQQGSLQVRYNLLETL